MTSQFYASYHSLFSEQIGWLKCYSTSRLNTRKVVFSQHQIDHENGVEIIARYMVYCFNLLEVQFSTSMQYRICSVKVQ